jgi:hypothetical protein
MRTHAHTKEKIILVPWENDRDDNKTLWKVTNLEKIYKLNNTLILYILLKK